MSRDVQMQSDVGALSLKGLGAFSTVLATLSADNVTPLALIQLEKLGAAFPTSGPCAEKAKGLLQRCCDVRVANLALAIGWRKNDTASLMADSAGGQAISLLCLCLTNLFKHEEAGMTLSKLSAAMLPHGSNFASVSQLADVALLLSGRLGAIGFGNILAQEVVRIQSAISIIETNNKSHPGLLDSMTPESVVDLFQLLSRALTEDQRLCRISGGRSMGLLVGLLQVLFHQDLSITVEGTVLQASMKPKIMIDVKMSESAGRTKIFLAERRELSQGNILPLETKISHRDSGRLALQYRWEGWLADELALQFATHNATLSQDILDMCRQITILVGQADQSSKDDRQHTTNDPDVGVNDPSHLKIFRRRTLLTLLGPRSNARLQACCDIVLRRSRISSSMDLHQAFDRLKALMSLIPSTNTCRCDMGHQWKCDVHYVWQNFHGVRGGRSKRCPHFQLWKAVAFTINAAIICPFLEPGPDAVVHPTLGALLPTLARLTTAMLWGDRSNVHHASAGDVWIGVEALVVGENTDETPWYVARSSTCCTVYPTVLRTMCVPPQQEVTFDCVDGWLLHGGRYHQFLRSEDSTTGPSLPSVLSPRDPIVPSNIGRLGGEPLVTIEERFEELIIHCSIEFEGTQIDISLRSVLLSYLGMCRTVSCPHTSSTPLRNVPTKFLETNVANPYIKNRLICIVMTRWSPMSQFLACHVGGCFKVLVRDCCLLCATRDVSHEEQIIFIVG